MGFYVLYFIFFFIRIINHISKYLAFLTGQIKKLVGSRCFELTVQEYASKSAGSIPTSVSKIKVMIISELSNT